MKRVLPGTRALRTFEAAARHLNFTRAADEVGLSAAAVSHQIREMEDQLDIVLFARTSRSMRLTPAGERLYQATSAALESLHRAAGEARRLQGGAGPLRLTLGPRFATNWLLPRLPAFQAGHPGVRLSFDVTDELRDLDADEADVAIRFGAGRYRGTESVRLFGTELVAVCHPSLAAGGALREPRDLQGFTLCHVACETGGRAWPRWRDWMAAAGIAGFDDAGCMSFEESSHVVQAAMDGGAIGLVELPMVARELDEGRLVRLFGVAVPVTDDFAYHLVHPAGAGQDPRIAALRDWLQSQVRAAMPPDTLSAA
ncbi:LysR substrate-binding domain-containing protein [Pseudoduganella albidiflava]|uniref:LysR family transcriptional regulator n=1 Tax=Pseudoduganella albidiflava TaxID=321983 RepID=A0ABX5S1G0_9BURK|nr:LysR substrate-binding domain-containing protein [Pseudoduganella albidiflava]QBI03833.1 LysR family transcriptional regulator [Pseudoduganella albidiflava]